MKTIFKIFILAFFTISNLVFADANVSIPGDSDGGGIHGPGQVKQNPIDMYLIWLGIMGVVTIYYIVKKNKKQLA